MHYIKDKQIIYVYSMPVLDSRMYIMPNDQEDNSPSALIIDPLVCEDALPVLTGLSSATILLTHSHYDHISGINWLHTILPCTVLCSEICARKLTDPHKNLSAFSAALVMDKTGQEQKQCMEYFDLEYACNADKTFPQETTFDFGSYHVELIYTPGHSDCSQCIRMTTKKQGLSPIIVFTGDSLVNGHDVITRLPSGSKKDYREITKPFLDTLSDDTLIMPGHGDWGRKDCLG